MSLSLNTSLSIAQSGLNAVQHELAVASQNVSNASTPGYVTEIANVSSRDAGGQGSGVVIQMTSLAVNQTLQDSLYAQNAAVAGLGVTTNALSAVSSAQGSTSADAGSSNTLADNLGNLSNKFTALDADPSSAVAQQAVVSSAGNLAGSIQTLSSTYQAQRQASEQALPAEVAQINSGLSTIGTLSKQIMQLRASGGDTADLENQRLGAMSALSSSLAVKFSENPAGDMLVSTANGLALPTRSSPGPLVVQAVTVGTADAYPGTIPGIELNGQDVTTSLTGGTLGANLTLRDTTLPTMQGELDAFSSEMANRFSAQGLNLFTDGAGNRPGVNPSLPPPKGQMGFSATVEVNPAVVANPASVRDGNLTTPNFTPNPSGGPVGFTTLISAVLGNTFGATSAAGVSQPAVATAGLGVNGTLTAPYSGAGTLATLATTLTASQAQTIADATTQHGNQTDIQTALQTTLTSTSGVSVDNQMANVVALQNAYEANAKVVAAVQSMFTALLTAVS